jgi:carboxylate-amine ligase
MRDLAVELVRWLDDVLDEVGVRAEVEYIDRLLSEGNSADRQLRIYRQTRSFEAVIDHLAEETVAGCL